eukprot:CAMPEP_0116130408 /NCGR_PEP_ID=MMETSP0329-20121206/8457_1 /TAXON_ID=697910 /ORGANISM="Pseudo-nitzschia arenysensis, Strain B593" /LENGTH=201 /DNA_ID=CAMNT_0003624771 /DNA_START=19 /DNA_END=624 /DNA_ORIENTATION=+
MTKTSTKEKTWPVLVYRKESDGWKKQAYSTSSKNRRRKATVTKMTPVAPRKDIIVFPVLRQKFSLQSEKDQGSVICRDNKILLVSKLRARALLIEFQSLEECLEFSDQFVRMNPRNILPAMPRNDSVVRNDRSFNLSQQHNAKPHVVVSDEANREVVSWIVKMLHDKSFLSYVQKIENCITETEDGMQILKGLEHGDLSSV